jgi:hypothetical protein
MADTQQPNQAQILDDLTSLQQDIPELDKDVRGDIGGDDPSQTGTIGGNDNPSIYRDGAENAWNARVPQGGRPDVFNLSTTSGIDQAPRDFDVNIQLTAAGGGAELTQLEITGIETGNANGARRGNNSNSRDGSASQGLAAEEPTDTPPLTVNGTVDENVDTTDESGETPDAENPGQGTPPPTLTRNSGEDLPEDPPPPPPDDPEEPEDPPPPPPDDPEEPPPVSGEFRYGISYVAFEYTDFATGEIAYIKFNFTTDTNQVNDVLDLAAYVGSKYGDVTDIFVHTGGANEITGVKGDNFYNVGNDGTVTAQATTEQFPTGKSGQVTGVETLDYPPADLYTFEPEVDLEPETEVSTEPEPDLESPADPGDVIIIGPDFSIDLRDVTVNNRWQAEPEEFWRIAETEQGWVLEINRDGDAGRRDRYDWETVAEDIDPETVDFREGVISVNYQDPDNPV